MSGSGSDFHGGPVFRVLGPVEIGAGDAVRHVTAYRQRTVLGLFLLRVNEFVSVEELIDAIWGEAPPPTAREQVQICVSRLRQMLTGIGEPRSIVTRSGGYVCQVDPSRVDAALFEEYSRAGEQHGAAGRTAEGAEMFRRALALWRGEVLAGASGKARLLADALVEKKIAVVEHCVELELELGKHRELIGELAGLVAEHPWREQLRAYLMVALHRSGRQAEALEAYRQARRDFIDELGIEPSDSLRQLESVILAGSDEPEIDGVVPSGPPRRAEEVVPRQLPAAIGDFTGRGLAVSAIEEKLGGPAAENTMRIVCIAGRGGIGKTALAVYVAHRLCDDYPDGQLFVNLRGTTDPVEIADVLARFLRATGLRDSEIPADPEELQDLYRSRLSGRRVLVVLDDIAGEEQITPLLPGSPSCSVIVTCRRPLGILPGAVTLNLDILEGKQARNLLARLVGHERASAESESLDALTQLCGHWPLAIRIIGARLAGKPHWTLSAMVERLQDEQGRLDEIAYGNLHVRSTLSISYDGLSPQAKRLFRLLGVCRVPDFALWVPAALLDTDLRTAGDVLEELIEAKLVDVVAAQGTRFGWHDLIRIFAVERLREEDPAARAAAERRLLGAYLGLVREAHRRLYGGDYTVLHGDGYRWELPENQVDRLLAEPMSWLEAEEAGLVAAVHRAAETGADEQCWDLALTSVTLFEARGQVHRWQETHERALECVRRAGNRRGEAAILCSLGSLRQTMRGDSGVELLEDALRLFAELGEQHGQALALRNLAFADRMAGHFDSAAVRYTAAVESFREVGDLVAEAHTLISLAQVHSGLRRFDEATRALSESMTLCHRTGNRRVEAQAWQRYGELYLQQELFGKAEEAFRKVLELVLPMGDRVGEVFALSGLGATWTEQGKYPESEKALTRALELCQLVSAHLGEGRVLLELGWLHLARQELNSADEYLLRASDSFEELRAKFWQARTLDALAQVRLRSDQRAAAGTLWRKALDLIRTTTSHEAEKLAERIERQLRVLESPLPE
ncbi:DNA-binding transcriptional activator of the SARP family [Saccharopolyspora kobensis]|uniref:DNA-binding transcriptional activator of the SARP family n=2 Tax=Saccharopolyspora kobensis TaxID=146035 RepID=A0A1H6DSH2_9PSEU|nr:DNA-binding transcriptional activator of the SARP family [Saccharopolyspora kobensis]SFE01827.1 DNA-binding transcriptional activator of the SARP family [Saccharopolyspora kobensis]